MFQLFFSFFRKYTKILSYDQRTRYKNDFNAQYQEYLSLHSRIEKIKLKFISLNNHLQNCDEGSEQYMVSLFLVLFFYVFSITEHENL